MPKPKLNLLTVFLFLTPGISYFIYYSMSFVSYKSISQNNILDLPLYLVGNFFNLILIITFPTSWILTLFISIPIIVFYAIIWIWLGPILFYVWAFHLKKKGEYDQRKLKKHVIIYTISIIIIFVAQIYFSKVIPPKPDDGLGSHPLIKISIGDK